MFTLLNSKDCLNDFFPLRLLGDKVHHLQRMKFWLVSDFSKIKSNARRKLNTIYYTSVIQE